MHVPGSTIPMHPRSIHPSTQHIAAAAKDPDSFASLQAIDYQWALACIPILFLLATLLTFFIRETRGVNIVDPLPEGENAPMALH